MKQHYHPHGTGKYLPHRLSDIMCRQEQAQIIKEICPRCGKQAELIQDGNRRLCGACLAGF